MPFIWQGWISIVGSAQATVVRHLAFLSPASDVNLVVNSRLPQVRSGECVASCSNCQHMPQTGTVGPVPYFTQQAPPVHLRSSKTLNM